MYTTYTQETEVCPLYEPKIPIFLCLNLAKVLEIAKH